VILLKLIKCFYKYPYVNSKPIIVLFMINVTHFKQYPSVKLDYLFFLFSGHSVIHTACDR